jgi:hypothetical protein
MSELTVFSVHFGNGHHEERSDVVTSGFTMTWLMNPEITTPLRSVMTSGNLGDHHVVTLLVMTGWLRDDRLDYRSFRKRITRTLPDGKG